MLRVIAGAFLLIPAYYAWSYLDRSFLRPTTAGRTPFAPISIMGIVFTIHCPLMAGIGLWRATIWGHVLAMITMAFAGLALFGMVMFGGETMAVGGLLVIAAISCYLLRPTILRVCGLLADTPAESSPRKIP